MDKSKKSQILKLSLIASLFFITPLIPTMIRSTYLYLMFNLIVLSLGAEAGLAPFFSKKTNTSEDKKHVNTTVVTPPMGDDSKTQESKEIMKPRVLLEKFSSDKIMVGTVRVVGKLKKCLSSPSIFFIGGNGENDPEEIVIEEYQEEDEAISEEELFSKTEMFIGNFYKQLKMQRKDSWNRIHGFYQKA